METKELLKEVVKEMINEEDVRQYVRETVKELFQDDIKYITMDEVRKLCKERAGEFVNEEIQMVLESKVFLDDGWGHKEEYGSFENFVREYIGKNLRDKWDVQKKVYDAVSKRIDQYAQKVVKERNEDRVDEVLEMIADNIKAGKA